MVTIRIFIDVCLSSPNYFSSFSHVTIFVKEVSFWNLYNSFNCLPKGDIVKQLMKKGSFVPKNVPGVGWVGHEGVGWVSCMGGVEWGRVGWVGHEGVRWGQVGWVMKGWGRVGCVM